MSSINQRQAVKLEIELSRLRDNLARMEKEDRRFALKTLKAAAVVFANAAAKHTPPDMGKAIDPLRYVDGAVVTAGEGRKPRSRRLIIDLQESVRKENTPFRSMNGKLLQQGYKYLVLIRGRSRRPCRTLQEAQRYAHQSYRGLLRASWGLHLARFSGKMPSVFAQLISKRRDLSRMANMNQIRLDPGELSLSIANQAVKTSDSFARTTVTNAEIAALKSVNTRLEKHFSKKQEL